jgi:outer membrane lipoprotein SlyB
MTFRAFASWRFTAASAMAMAFAAVAASAQTPPAMPPSTAAKRAPQTAAAPSDDCGQCGKVVSIRQTTVKQSWTPLGGGIGVGGAPDLGSQPSGMTTFQFGPGLANQGLVIIGSAGGASYQKKPNSYDQPRWEVTVKLDNGQTRVATLGYEPYVVEGDRVRVAGNNVELVE